MPIRYNDLFNIDFFFYEIWKILNLCYQRNQSNCNLTDAYRICFSDLAWCQVVNSFNRWTTIQIISVCRVFEEIWYRGHNKNPQKSNRCYEAIYRTTTTSNPWKLCCFSYSSIKNMGRIAMPTDMFDQIHIWNTFETW